MAKRTTIGASPLDALIPPSPSRTAVAEPEEAKTAPSKVRATFHLPVDVTERAKNAVYWTPGLTLADLAAQALSDALDRMEKKRGEPFPRRKADLKGGRPMK